jgi:farnesyl-diphosphate farnesyltransferase
MPVSVYYLILRGLDTVEDDTSILIDVKQSLLRRFHDNLDQCGWNFTGNRPEEKDRELLVQIHNIIAEFGKLKPTYRAIIKEITHKMGTGMADFAGRAALGYGKVISVEEYDIYCWHVAGIVGEGLTHFFVKAGMGDKNLINRPLYRSMGLLLQKNNIIRDDRELLRTVANSGPEKSGLIMSTTSKTYLSQGIPKEPSIAVLRWF